jgi:Holliday junction DNA helicase RuvA
MIGFLSGKPEVLPGSILVHINNVGYEVIVGSQMLIDAAKSDSIDLYIYTHVKEDEISLFGFSTYKEKELFLKLLAISGIGPKTALTIVDQGVTQLITAVQTANVRYFSKIPRVGKKSAQKIIIELKTKLGGFTDLNLTPLTSFESDLVAALESLGFNQEESESAVKQLNLSESMNIQEGLQQAMRLLAKTK